MSDNSDFLINLIGKNDYPVVWQRPHDSFREAEAEEVV
jgi:hypothetical protein